MYVYMSVNIYLIVPNQLRFFRRTFLSSKTKNKWEIKDFYEYCVKPPIMKMYGRRKGRKGIVQTEREEGTIWPAGRLWRDLVWWGGPAEEGLCILGILGKGRMFFVSKRLIEERRLSRIAECSFSCSSVSLFGLFLWFGCLLLWTPFLCVFSHC